MIDVKDIFNSWVKSYKPSPMELERAKERYDICLGCDAKREMIAKKEWSLICGDCGCPISKKIYSSVATPCPREKWIDVDKKYTKGFRIKKDSSVL